MDASDFDWSWLLVAAIWFLAPLLFRMLRRKVRHGSAAAASEARPAASEELDRGLAVDSDGAPKPIEPR